LSGYIGRFAPSPTGLLHAGSLVAALASWLDARAHGGQWLVRIEDVDTPRCIPGADHALLAQLAACGLHPDAPPVWQSQRTALYQSALDTLIALGQAYPCACSRKDIEAALQSAGLEKPRNGELVYPGTCRHGLQGKLGRAWRSATTPIGPTIQLNLIQNRPLAPVSIDLIAINSIAKIEWTDRRLGPQQQDVASEVGDFVLRRADGLFAYQLAVVVDDAAQGITHVVRGEDLADNTARQILLQRALGYPTPQYLHTPLVLGANGEKLSKQNGALAIGTSTPRAALDALARAGAVLGLDSAENTNPTIEGLLAQWASQWQHTSVNC
jgi:glutamyl-Q tRNA(Asp) synthetase